jgi:hypothetical protein
MPTYSVSEKFEEFLGDHKVTAGKRAYAESVFFAGALAFIQILGDIEDSGQGDDAEAGIFQGVADEVAQYFEQKDSGKQID